MKRGEIVIQIDYQIFVYRPNTNSGSVLLSIWNFSATIRQTWYLKLWYEFTELTSLLRFVNKQINNRRVWCRNINECARPTLAFVFSLKPFWKRKLYNKTRPSTAPPRFHEQHDKMRLCNQMATLATNILGTNYHLKKPLKSIRRLSRARR